MPTKSNFDLLVIGAGILGTFHAFHALRAGQRVALIEQHKKPQSASTRNFGQVVPSGMNAKWQTIGRRSLEIYQELQRKVDISIQPNGSIYIASNEDEVGLIEELALRNKDVGYPSMLLTKSECLNRWPVLRPTYCKAGLFFPEEVSLDPRFAVQQTIAFMVEQMGLFYFPDCQIKHSYTNKDRVKLRSSDNREFMGSQAILCNGSEFKNLFPRLFRNSDLAVSKLQMLRTVPQKSVEIKGNILTGRTIRRYESFSECPSFKTVKACEPQSSFAKKHGVHILLTQAADGTVVLGDSHEYADARDKDDLSYEIDHSINRFMLEEAKKIFNLQNWQLQNTWFGVYSQCKNQDIFQQTLDKRLHVVTGIGGKGMTGSPGFAEQNIQHLLQTGTAVT